MYRFVQRKLRQPSWGTGSIQPEFSFNMRSTVSYDKYDLSLRWRYVDSVSVEPEVADQFLEDFRRIKARHYLDLTLRASVHENLDLTFSVINLTDVQPPVVGSTIGTTAFNSGNTYPRPMIRLGVATLWLPSLSSKAYLNKDY
ncbi:TonB-dependent receptor [Hankyongella ginsenosidimutans]|uniref:TonB-dependent receptor n=1 Tax=Hankyongella ginsenosidimutans TaxID=1763828 RepID=A0A4D7C6Z9_9SPHN|nr:TonB-dependent receptor [Hankyongella ginsenosidimutans]QCI79635.1 TonB-dependent receptor [Hankyongella ginsenosidimutans]